MTHNRTCENICIVVPVYNEEDVLPLFWNRLQSVLSAITSHWNVIFVDDGSKDRSLPFLLDLCEREPRVGVLVLSRNFGHQAAITAGLQHAKGDAVITMDSDLQDLPEIIPEMVKSYETGSDVVYARRRSRQGESFLKKLTAKWYYRLMTAVTRTPIPQDVGDFRLVSKRVLDVLNVMGETHRYLRGMVTWAGFMHTFVDFDREGRAAGETKYTWMRMIRFAWDGLTSFSAVPVRLGMSFGLCILIAALLYCIRVLYVRFVLQTAVPGWTTIVVMQLIFSGLMFVYLGVIGDYVGRIYEQGKKRPLYVVSLKRGACQ